MENVELASAEQLPKYSQHNDSSGVVPPYESDGSHEIGSEGLLDTGTDMASFSAQEGTPNDSHDGELDGPQHVDADSVPVNPLEDTHDASNGWYQIWHIGYREMMHEIQPGACFLSKFSNHSLSPQTSFLHEAKFIHYPS